MKTVQLKIVLGIFILPISCIIAAHASNHIILKTDSSPGIVPIEEINKIKEVNLNKNPGCGEETPRADVLRTEGLPYYFTFEVIGEESGKGLVPMHTNIDGTSYTQGVVPFYGKPDPLGSGDAVCRILRPENGLFGGYEDLKFQPFDEPIDFSEYHQWTLEVLIPEEQDFSGQLSPQVELILHDSDENFWERWTVISKTISTSDFGTWVKLDFDGTYARAANTGQLLPQQTGYNQITLRFGGSNHMEKGIFYVKDLVPMKGNLSAETSRAQALKDSGLPYYFTFESGNPTSGVKLSPRISNPGGGIYGQGVEMTYGVPDPAGSSEMVTKYVRPENGSFGGYEDFKFQHWPEKIDFSNYHKFKIDIYIPSSNDFSGALEPQIELILHDNNENFWERWTVISHQINASDFDQWVTVELDGSNARAAGTGVLLSSQTTYDSFTIRMGGSNHKEKGVFYIKDLVPVR